MIKQLKAARRVSTPLIAITTPDPAATIETLCDGLNGNVAKLVWDVATGLSYRNAEGKTVLADIAGDMDPTEGNPFECARLAQRLPEGAILFMMMANRFFKDPGTIQAIWNLRDNFKQDSRTLVMLGSDMELPPELQGDVVVFDEQLPDAAQLEQILDGIYEATELKPKGNELSRSVEALQGLPAFQAEQVAAMSLTRAGMDTDNLWERKRRQIEQTRGLKVVREAETFDDVGGVERIKAVLTRYMKSGRRPNAIVMLDEIEKMFAGAFGDIGDSSGTSQDQLGAMLTWLQDHNARGMIFVGLAGSAKSMLAKAAGSAGDIPTIQLDLGAAKGSLVGESEATIRQALKVIDAVSNGRTLWIATCNKIAQLPPELRRRFTFGTYYFDLPTKAEREEIWPKQLKAHDLPLDTERPDDRNWTGAEIKACCDIALDMEMSLVEAAEQIVPVARSGKAQLDALRSLADGVFNSASYPGVYTRDHEEPKASGKKSRRSITKE